MQNQINKTNKIANSTKNAETTIIIANSAYLISPVPIYHVKAGYKLVQYKPIGKFTTEERTLLSQSLKASCIYINEVYSLLKEAKSSTLEKVESILCELEENTLDTLLANIQQIQDKILSTKLVVLKENYLDTENDHVLASVKDDDTFTFTVYNNFFDEKEFKDNRAGVIIHELCHLCDIEEGADMYDVNSAECVKNIILCLCEKLTLKQIRKEYARKQEPQERDDDILTYDENQPRVPAGSPEGGQWTDSGGSGSSNAKERFSEYVKASMQNIDFSKIEDELGSLADKIEEEGKALAKKSLEESSKDLDKIIDDTMSEIAENQEIADEETLKEKLKEIGESIIEDFRKNAETENKVESQSKEKEMQAFVDFLSKDDSDGFSDKLEIAKDKLLNNKITELAKDFKSKSEKNILPKIKDFINYIKSALSKESEDIDSSRKKNINESTSDDFRKNTKAEKKSTTGYKDKNFTLSSVGTDRTSDKNKVELEDCVRFKDENDNENATWVGYNASHNGNYKEGESVFFLTETEVGFCGLNYNLEKEFDYSNLQKEDFMAFEASTKSLSVIKSIADKYGCANTGRATSFIAPENPRYDKYGTDIDAVVLGLKIYRIPKENLKNVKLIKTAVPKPPKDKKDTNSQKDFEDAFNRNPAKYTQNYNGSHVEYPDEEGLIEDPKANEAEIYDNSEIFYEGYILIDIIGKKVILLNKPYL